MTTSTQEFRAQVCAALAAATGLNWQPNLQDSHRGPEQEIWTYAAPVMGAGKLVLADDIMRKIDRCPDGRKFEVHVLGFSKDAGEFARYANMITIPDTIAADAHALDCLRQSAALQDGFKAIREAPVMPAVMDAHRQLQAGKKPDFMAIIINSGLAARA